MIGIRRADPPPMLVARGAGWTDRYVERRGADPHARFAWPQVDGEPLNHALVELLVAMTANHCAYCDHFELGEGATETIDHFRPKSRYPQLAFAWDNLFPACNQCQGAKGEQFEEPLLKPDEPGYAFSRYFIVNLRTGEIESNGAASRSEQARAAVAIRIFGLNEGSRPRARLRAFRWFYTKEQWPNHAEELHLRPYRFLAPPL